jgi:XTP/dITP diphosphohydrolase
MFFKPSSDTSQSTMNQVVIIGAGVAGIATYHRLRKYGIHAIIIEAGKSLKDRLASITSESVTFDSSEGINGFGGAGLFSDRKWSGFPAGTGLLKQNVYELRDTFTQIVTLLKTALPSHTDEFDRLLKSTFDYLGDHTVSSEEIERKYNDSNDPSKHHDTLKKYPSVPIKNFNDGVKILKYLNALVDPTDVHYGVTIKKIDRLRDGSGYVLSGTNSAGNERKFNTKKLVMANGRFGPKLLQNSPFGHGTYKRTELGFRIRIDPGSSLEKGLIEIMQGDALTNDPKIIINRDYVLFGKKVTVQFRTFCVCLPKGAGENGYMVKTSDSPTGLTTYSGSSSFDEFNARKGHVDGIIEGSNMGIMMRITDPETVDKIHQSHQMAHATNITVDPTKEIDEILQVMSKVYPSDICNIIYNGINETVNYITGDYPHEALHLYGPCIEGVGSYPDVDIRSYELKEDSNVYVAGDASGYARGLMQAMAMGDMCGKYIAQSDLNGKLLTAGVIERYQDVILPHSSYGKVVMDDEATSKNYVDSFNLVNETILKTIQCINKNTELNKKIVAMANGIVPVRFQGNASHGGVLYEIHHFFLDGKVYGKNSQLHYITRNSMVGYISLCNGISQHLRTIQNVVAELIDETLPKDAMAHWNSVRSSVIGCMEKSIKNYKFKSCVLALRTRKDIANRNNYTDIPVMQSAFKFKPVSADLYDGKNDDALQLIERYVVASFASVLDHVIQTTIDDVNMALLMCRTKIETQEPAILPVGVEEGNEALYYECYVKVNMKNLDGTSLSYYQKKRLIHDIAGMFEGSESQVDIFNVMAVSINLLKHPEKGQQFFLTYRTDTKEEMEFIRRNFNKIIRKIAQVSNFTNFNFKCYTDAEFVVYDTNRDLDLPWFPIKTGFLHKNYKEVINRLVTSDRHLLLLTSNKNKYNEYQYNPLVMKHNICIHHYNYDTGHSGDMDLTADVKRKARVAYDYMKRPIMVEGSGIRVGSTNFPGAMTEKVIRELGLDGFCKNFGGKDAMAVTVLAKYDGRDFEIATSAKEGTISTEPRGENGFGWDSIFVSKGGKTFAQMTTNEKNLNSMRGDVINKFFVEK